MNSHGTTCWDQSCACRGLSCWCLCLCAMQWCIECSDTGFMQAAGQPFRDVLIDASCALYGRDPVVIVSGSSGQQMQYRTACAAHAMPKRTCWPGYPCKYVPLQSLKDVQYCYLCGRWSMCQGKPGATGSALRDC